MSVLLTGLRRAVGATPDAKSTISQVHLQGTPPPWLSGGGPGSIDLAIGLPAWLSVIRRLAEAAGMSPLVVYSGGRDARERAVETWQWRLLHDRSVGEYSSFTFSADAAASLASTANAYLRKFKSSRGQVGELMVLDPRNVRPRRVDGEIVFDDTTNGSTKTRGRDEIIHVRGFTFGVRSTKDDDGTLEGISPIRALRTSIGTGLQRQQWERSYFQNDARPGIALKFPPEIPIEMAQKALDYWNDHHRGPENAGRAAALTGGGDISVIPPIKMDDAQFVESNRLSLQTIAGLYGVPPSLVGDATDKGLVGEAAQIQLAIFGLGPILTPLEQAISRDPDIFPPGSGLFCEALPDALVRPDLLTRYSAYRMARQGGWKTANELRALDNEPPHPDGDVLQVTPVGGEGNPAPDPPDPGRPKEDD